VRIVDGYREEIEHIDIEGQKQQRVDVIIDTESDMGGTMRGNAAFIRETEVFGAVSGSKQTGSDEGKRSKKSATDKKEDDRQMHPLKDQSGLLVVEWWM
jgi:hypothetical protein